MLIRLFRSHQNVQVLAFLIISVLLWGDGFYRMQPLIAGHSLSPFYDLLFGWLADLPFLSVFIAFLMLLGEAVLFNSILTEEGLAMRNSFLPAAVYILFFSYNPGLLRLYPVIPANIMLILAFRMILKTRHKEKAYQEVFTAGIFLSFAAMINIWHLVFFPVILIALIIYRSYSLRDWMIGILGLITPVFYLMFFYFMTDQLLAKHAEFGNFFRTMHLFIASYNMQVIAWAVSTIIALITLISFLRMIIRSSEHLIQLRKAFQIFLWTFVLAVCTIPLFRDNVLPSSSIVLLPAVVFFSVWVQNAKKIFVPELSLWLFLAAILASKIML
jgi:hypothetical protein